LAEEERQSMLDILAANMEHLMANQRQRHQEEMAVANRAGNKKITELQDQLRDTRF
jgi:hypothetical protein